MTVKKLGDFKHSEKLKDIKMIALDLDGTTLTRSGLTRRTKETLEKAIARGYNVVIATGRPFSALPQKVLDIKGIQYIITSNGAHIVNTSGDFLYSSYVDRDAILKVRQYMMSHDYPIEVFTGGNAYVDQSLWDDLTKNGSTYMGWRYILRTRKPVPDIYQFWLENIDEIEDLNIHFENLDIKHLLWQELESIGNITVTTSYAHNIEIGGATTSKASALVQLCKMSGCTLDEIIAFGDSHNDLQMLKECGLSVAMGNASDELKNAADFIAPTNEEEGVCYTIRKYLFDENPSVPRKRPGLIRRIKRKIGRLFRKKGD